MTQFILQVPDEKDLKDLLPLFQRFGFVLKPVEKDKSRSTVAEPIDILKYYDELTETHKEVFQKLAQ